MTTIQAILITALLFAWLCISISFLVTSIQSFVYDRKREKRELAQAERDKEYHAKRMEEDIDTPCTLPEFKMENAL